MVLEVQWPSSSAPQAASQSAGSAQQQQQQLASAALAGGQHRQRMAASSTDYVGVVRQRVGQLTGLPASSLRLLCGGGWGVRDLAR